jgi:hypothetical protein
LFFGVTEFAGQIGFHLEGGTSEDGVDSASRFRHALFERYMPALGAQTVHWEFSKRRLDLVVSCLGCTFTDDFCKSTFVAPHWWSATLFLPLPICAEMSSPLGSIMPRAAEFD